MFRHGMFASALARGEIRKIRRRKKSVQEFTSSGKIDSVEWRRYLQSYFCQPSTWRVA